MNNALKPGIKISREEIVSLPLFHFPGQITLVRTENELVDALGRISSFSVVGMDTETRPSFRKGKVNPPTLVQIAAGEEVFLFHLGWLPLGAPLADIFENDKIIKAGVAIENDFRFLARIHPFTPRGILDLGDTAKRQGIEIQSLRGLAAYFLGLHISKTEQCSNWAKKELTPRQIRYAATDAWASLAVYERMKELGLLGSTDAIPQIVAPAPKKAAKKPRKTVVVKRTTPAKTADAPISDQTQKVKKTPARCSRVATEAALKKTPVRRSRSAKAAQD